MSRIDQLVGTWREDLAAEPAYRTEDIDEIEEHLREEIDQLRKTGLATEEVFRVALGRVGTMSELADEFGKVNADSVWLNRLLWVFGGWLALQFVDIIARILTAGTMLAFNLQPPFAVKWVFLANLSIQILLAAAVFYLLFAKRLSCPRQMLIRGVNSPARILGIAVVLVFFSVAYFLGTIAASELVEEMANERGSWEDLPHLKYLLAFSRFGWQQIFPLAALGWTLYISRRTRLRLPVRTSSGREQS